MNYCSRKDRRFCKEEKEKKKRAMEGKSKEEKGEVERDRRKRKEQPCCLFLLKTNPLYQVTTTPPSNRQN